MNPLLQVLGASHSGCCYMAVKRVTQTVVTWNESESGLQLLQPSRASHTESCYRLEERVTYMVVTEFQSEPNNPLLHQ